MSGFVGKEWQAVAAGGRPTRRRRAAVAGAAADRRGGGGRIYRRDQAYRFERDASGAWLLHRHAPGDDPNTVHVPILRRASDRPGADGVQPDLIERTVAYDAPGMTTA